MIIRIVLIALSLLAPFFVPWPYAVMLGLVASLMVPPVALIIGALFEALYGTGLIPYAFLAGVIGFFVSYGVRAFMKARIMGA